MTREFIENHAGTMHEKLTGMGAPFKFSADDPETVFLENGYTRTEKVAIIERAVVLQSPNIPRDVFEALLANLPRGLAIHVFQVG